MTDPLWQPSADRIANANITAFARELERRFAVSLPSYRDLHAFSVDRSEDFWDAFWDHAGIVAETKGDRVLADGGKMPGAQFFPDARLNFRREPAAPARRQRCPRLLVGRQGEAPAELARAVRACLPPVAGAEGRRASDRGTGSPGFVPNMPETIAAMLAATSLGAIWTSCSPDFGVRGVLDRFGQTEPKVLFTADGYFYNGKTIESLPRVREFIADLPSVEKVVVMPLIDSDPMSPGRTAHPRMADFVAPDSRPGEIDFVRVCRSTTRSISCIRRARPVCRNASSTGRAAR